MLRREIDLILVVASSLALAAVILTVPSAAPARVVLGLPFILLFPGYALMAAVFPRASGARLARPHGHRSQLLHLDKRPGGVLVEAVDGLAAVPVVHELV